MPLGFHYILPEAQLEEGLEVTSPALFVGNLICACCVFRMKSLYLTFK